MSGWTLDERLLSGLIFDDPWADEELPSLVAVDNDGTGEIIGFTGVQVRRLRMDGQMIRGVHSGHGVVKPDSRGSAIGALMIGRVLSGPQDITWSDGTIDAVAGVFRVYGGHLDHLRACDWMLVLRPARWLRKALVGGWKQSSHEGVSQRSLVPVAGLPFQAAGPRLVRSAFPQPTPGLTGEDASAATIVGYLPAINKRQRVWVDHDEQHLDHLFGLVREFKGLEAFKGPLITRLVRRNGRPIGWYAYVARAGGASRVLHLAATEREVDAVLEELISHARDAGSAALAGRAEPHLQHALSKRLAVLGYARQPTILIKNPELASVAATGSCLLTRLDGDVFSI
jgi:hypothetical protein